jgi:hypothetical protein
VVQRQPVKSQEQLRRYMRAAGFDVTQATLSRDIRELGLVKGGADGAYQAGSRDAGNGHGGRSLLQSNAPGRLLSESSRASEDQP